MQSQSQVVGGNPVLENRAGCVDLKSVVGDIPWGIGYVSEEFRLVALNNR
jgi:hypothetical protein